MRERINSIRRYWSVVGVLLFICSCSKAAADSDSALARQRIVVTGASTIAPLMAEIGKRYEKAHPNVRVDVQTGGSARGVTDVRQGLADVGLVSRALKPDERDLLPTPIALDGVCLIVHRDNPVQLLSDDQVRDIYRGTITSWDAVGGAQRKIA